MVEQQLILTAALAGVATACADIPPTRRPALRHPGLPRSGNTPTRFGGEDTQEVWRRILFRSTGAA